MEIKEIEQKIIEIFISNCGYYFEIDPELFIDKIDKWATPLNPYHYDLYNKIVKCIENMKIKKYIERKNYKISMSLGGLWYYHNLKNEK